MTNSTSIRAQHTWMPYIIVGLASLFYIYDYFIQVAPGVMTDQLMRDFAINASGLGVLGASFFYSYTLMQIPAGLLLDRFGARALLTFSVFVSACGVTLFGYTHSFYWAGFSRFIIGLGSAFAFISALYLVSRWFSHRYFALIAGLIQLAGCLGSLFGEAPLAMTINHFGWRPTMVMTGFITFGLTLVYWGLIRNGDKRTDAHSALTLSSEFQRLKYVLKQSQVWWIGCCGLVSWVPVATVGVLWGVPYLMKVYGWSNTVAGEVCSIFWLGLGLGSPFIGWVSSRIQQRIRPTVMCFSVGIIGALLLLEANQLPAWSIVLGLFLLGFSASVQSLTFGITKDIVPYNVFGTASGFINMAAIIGGAISQPLVGFLLDLQWDGTKLGGIPVYTIQDYKNALFIIPIAGLIGLLIAIFKIKETNCQQA